MKSSLNRYHRKGFTLVEMLVAVGVFSVLITIGIGGFTHALHTQRQVAGLISAHSNASLALEQMAREIRTGYLFCNDINANGNPNPSCLGHCSIAGGADGNTWSCDMLDFYSATGQNVDYRLSASGAIERSETGASGTFVPITGNGAVVKYLSFTIFGNTEGDHWPPRVMISLGVSANSTDPVLAGNVLKLQTTISAREIDCVGSSC